MSECMNERTNEWIKEWRNEPIEWLDERTGRNEMKWNPIKWNELELTEMTLNEKKKINMIESEMEWMNAWMNEWMNEWMNRWMNEWLNEWDLPTLALSEDQVGKMGTRL